MSAMKNMGGMAKIMEMIPGMSQLKMPKEMLNVQEGTLEKWKHIMDSMTHKELTDPDIMSASRVERIAKGSGTKLSEIRELLKKLNQSKKMTKMLKGRKMKQMMKQFGGNLPEGMELPQQ